MHGTDNVCGKYLLSFTLKDLLTHQHVKLTLYSTMETSTASLLSWADNTQQQEVGHMSVHIGVFWQATITDVVFVDAHFSPRNLYWPMYCNTITVYVLFMVCTHFRVDNMHIYFDRMSYRYNKSPLCVYYSQTDVCYLTRASHMNFTPAVYKFFNQSLRSPPTLPLHVKPGIKVRCTGRWKTAFKVWESLLLQEDFFELWMQNLVTDI